MISLDHMLVLLILLNKYWLNPNLSLFCCERQCVHHLIRVEIPCGANVSVLALIPCGANVSLLALIPCGANVCAGCSMHKASVYVYSSDTPALSSSKLQENCEY